MLPSSVFLKAGFLIADKLLVKHSSRGMTLSPRKSSKGSASLLYASRVRWAASGTLLALLLVARVAGTPYPWTLFLALLMGAASNLVFDGWYKLHQGKLLLYGQIILDAIVIAALVHFTGGIDSPFAWFFLVIIVAVSLVDRRPTGFIAAAISSLLYSAVILLEHFGLLGKHAYGPGEAISNAPLTAAALRIASQTALYFLSATLIAIYLGRLQDSERWYRGLVENATDLIFTLDLSGNIISANAAALDFTGYLEEDLPMEIARLLPEDSEKSERRRFLRAIASPKPSEPYEMAIVKKDGSLAFFEVSLRLAVQDGKPVGVQGIARNITEKKRIQEEVERKNLENARLFDEATRRADDMSKLHRMIGTIVSSLDLDEVLEAIVSEAMNSLAGCSAAIGMIDGDSVYYPTAIGVAAKDIVKMRFDLGASFLSKPAFEGTAVVVPDLQIPENKQAKVAISLGIRSAIFMPLKIREKTIGVLSVYKSEIYEFSEEERTLLSAFANQAAVALESARLFEQVARGKREWEETFDAIVDPLSIYDRSLTIMRVNKAVAKLTGLQPSELIGRRCYETYYNRFEPCANCPSHVAILSGKPAFDERVLHGSRTFQIWAFPVFDPDGGVSGVVEYAHDITEQKKLESQLVQSTKLAAVGELAANIAHEINNPLTSVLGYASFLLKKQELSSEVKQDLKIIEAEAIRARSIVRHLLDFARQTPLRPTEIDVRELVGETLTLVRRLAQVSNIEIVEGYDPEIPPVKVDANQIKQVFINLINNALHAMPDGGILTVHTSSTPDGVVVSFSDTGAGISPDHLDRVFEPFFSTKDEKGTGLGLSVSYRIIEAHGGLIAVESKQGEGSTFAVKLPAAEKAMSLG